MGIAREILYESCKPRNAPKGAECVPPFARADALSRPVLLERRQAARLVVLSLGPLLLLLQERLVYHGLAGVYLTPFTFHRYFVLSVVVIL